MIIRPAAQFDALLDMPIGMNGIGSSSRIAPAFDFVGMTIGRVIGITAFDNQRQCRPTVLQLIPATADGPDGNVPVPNQQDLRRIGDGTLL